MKYLKISFIILIFSIIIFSSANSKVIYVEEGSEEASKSKSKLLTDKVIYKIYNEYEINPIYCLAIFPFEFSKKTKANQQEKENLRKIFYAYISPLGIVDIELSRLNYLQKKYPRDSYAELTLREKCNSYFVGKIHTLKITTLGVFSKNSVGGTFSIYNAKTNKLVWSSSHVASSKAGKIPKTPIDLVLGAVAASKNISEEQVFRVYGDLARRITKTIPDYDLIPQVMFKKEEQIRFDRIDVDTMEVADTVYAQVVKQTAENSEKVIEAKTKQHEAEKTALAAIEEAFKAAEENLSRVKSSRWPRLTLKVQGDKYNPDSFGFYPITRSLDEYDFYAGVNLEADVYSGGRKQSQIRAANQELNVLLYEKNSLVKTIKSNTERLISELESGDERIDIFLKAFTANERSRDNLTLQFQTSNISLLDLLQAERDYLESSENMVFNQRAVLLSSYTQLAILGRLLNYISDQSDKIQ